jgi:cobalamin biosynthesis protein CobD/CbiB
MVYKAKHLAVIFYYYLSWSDHVSHLFCCKVNRALIEIRRLADAILFTVRMQLFVTLVISIFTYGNCVYVALVSFSLTKLTVAFRRLFDHLSDVSDSI